LLEALKDKDTVKPKESFAMSLHPQKNIRQHINLPNQVPEACSSKHQKHHRGENITMLLETSTGVGSIS
jgi:hypothetical protein